MGYIQIHNEIQEHWIMQDAKHFKWWVMILLNTNYYDSDFKLGYKVFKIKRGQATRSLRTWALLFNTSTKTVVKFFKLLEMHEMIKRKTIGKGKQSTTLITVTNFNKYHSKMETQSKTLSTTQGKRKLPTKDTIKQLNNKTIIERKEQFGKLLHPFIKKYKNSMLTEFYNHWTEHGDKDRLMAFEKKSSFSVAHRLGTWKRNDLKWNKDKSTESEIRNKIIPIG